MTKCVDVTSNQHVIEKWSDNFILSRIDFMQQQRNTER